jgi:hypothetical protein
MERQISEKNRTNTVQIIKPIRSVVKVRMKSVSTLISVGERGKVYIPVVEELAGMHVPGRRHGWKYIKVDLKFW